MKTGGFIDQWQKGFFLGSVILAALVTIAAFAHQGKDEVQRIVQECKSAEDRALCYEREVPRLFPRLSLPEVFEVIRQIRREDPTYQFCHVLAHNLGRDAVANDPARWIDLMPQNPFDGLCSNGFIHGVIIGRFRDAVLDNATLAQALPDLERACEPRENWAPTPLDRSICYHGMGHLFDFITDADLQKSLDLCKRIDREPTQDFEGICKAGVFMQIYQPLEPEDYALIKKLPIQPDAANYRKICYSFKDPAAQGACLREAWPLFFEELKTGKGVVKFCSGEPNLTEEDLCYVGVATIIGRQLLDDPAAVASACDAFPKDYMGKCYLAGAQAVIEEDRTRSDEAIALCNRGPVATFCIQNLLNRRDFLFAPGSRERDAFCSALPSPYREDCRK